MTTNNPQNNPNAATMKDDQTGTRGADRKPREDKDGNTNRGKGFAESDSRDAATRDASREADARQGNQGSQGHPDSRRTPGADKTTGQDRSARPDVNVDAKELDEAMDRKPGATNAKKDADCSKDSDRAKHGKHNA
jgi:hypothetical protein